MKVEFKGEPMLSPFGDDDEWIICEPFAVIIDGTPLVIPAGFVTDLASVPKWLPLARSFLSGKARRAAIVHDYLYVKQADKKYADDVFMAAMKAEKVNGPVRWLFYTAVHLFGHGIYNDKGGEPSFAETQY